MTASFVLDDLFRVLRTILLLRFGRLRRLSLGSFALRLFLLQLDRPANHNSPLRTNSIMGSAQAWVCSRVHEAPLALLSLRARLRRGLLRGNPRRLRLPGNLLSRCSLLSRSALGLGSCLSHLLGEARRLFRRGAFGRGVL